jgi:hypothetical protein
MQTGCHQARVAQQAGTQRNQKSTCMSGSPQARTAPTRAESALGALGLAGRHDGNALAPRRLGVRGLLGGHGRPLTVLQRRDDRAGLLDNGWARQVAARACGSRPSDTGPNAWDPPSRGQRDGRPRPGAGCRAAAGGRGRRAGPRRARSTPRAGRRLLPSPSAVRGAAAAGPATHGARHTKPYIVLARGGHALAPLSLRTRRAARTGRPRRC